MNGYRFAPDQLFIAFWAGVSAWGAMGLGGWYATNCIAAFLAAEALR